MKLEVQAHHNALYALQVIIEANQVSVYCALQRHIRMPMKLYAFVNQGILEILILLDVFHVHLDITLRVILPHVLPAQIG